MPNKKWHIEGEFRDGSYRLRDGEGRYYSVSNAILEEVSEFEWFTEDDLVERLGVERQIILEHLGHLRERGVIEGDNGSWTRDSEYAESALEDSIRRIEENRPPWERTDHGDYTGDESTY